MNYKNMVDCACIDRSEADRTGGMPRPLPSMTDTLKESDNIAHEVLSMARTISAHLFGISDLERTEKEAEPTCFRDELDRTKSTLLEISNELRSIMAALGL